MKFRKKPVIIDATQWFRNGDHPLDNATEMFDCPAGQRPVAIREGLIVRYYRHPDVSGKSLCEQCGKTYQIHGWVDTLEQGHRVCPGDWIITGVKGEIYPCKPDIFELTYDLFITDNAENYIGSEDVSKKVEKVDTLKPVAWMLVRKSDNFVRGLYSSNPCLDQFAIADFDGDEYVELYRKPTAERDQAIRDQAIRDCADLADNVMQRHLWFSEHYRLGAHHSAYYIKADLLSLLGTPEGKP